MMTAVFTNKTVYIVGGQENIAVNTIDEFDINNYKINKMKITYPNVTFSMGYFRTT